jgi:hypothetical protein
LQVGNIGCLNFGCCYSQYIALFKLLDHVWFEVLEAVHILHFVQ